VHIESQIDEAIGKGRAAYHQQLKNLQDHEPCWLTKVLYFY